MVNIALNQHPDCLAEGEIFDYKENHGDDGIEVATRFYAKFLDKKAVGFKLLRFQAQQRPAVRVWGWICRNRLPVLHLSRRNTVQQLISHEVGNRTKDWTNFWYEEHRPTARAAINWTPADWLAKIEVKIAGDRDLAKLFSQQPYLHIFYEDLCEDFQLQMRRIQGFLDLDIRPLKIPTRKTNLLPVSEHIVNLDEVRGLLETNGYGWMLADPQPLDAAQRQGSDHGPKDD